MSHKSKFSLSIPDVPPRPSSTPPEGRDGRAAGLSPPSPLLKQPSKPMGNINVQALPENATAASSAEHAMDHHHQDERTSSRTSRFVGNMLVVRIGRASWQSLESTARLPFYLSPWGDNHPFTMPNVRKRDVALAGVAHFGLEALGASAVTLVEKVVEHAVSATVEQTADEGLAKVAKARGNGKGNAADRRVGMNSLTLRIRHKLIGEAAELVLHGLKDSDDKKSCAKGWFCPYLYASGREPEIARATDWSMAQLLTPRLAADASIAPTLLSTFAETSTPILSPFGTPWEDPSSNPTVSYPTFRRMAILLTGISPYRYITDKSNWSHARIPNEARITFHLFTHVPAIVIPIIDESPILAWSPWTVAQMLDGKSHYDMKRHIRDLLDFFSVCIDEQAVFDYIPGKDDKKTSGWKELMSACLESMLSSVINVPDAIKTTSEKCCELERTGIVAFRY